MGSIKTRIYLLFLLISFTLPAIGADISVKARIDSVNLLMGRIMNLHIEVVENRESSGSFTIFDDKSKTKDYIGLCGDSVELSTSYTVDTIDLGSGKIQLNYNIPVQAFDSGTYTLPKFLYVSNHDSVYSNHLTFNVIPVDVTADDEISGLAPVEEPDGKRFYDWVPDWILDFWWIFLIIVLAICAFLWALNRYGKKGLPLLHSKPLPKPWEKALLELQALKDKKLWEQGMEKEYFTDLTDILRTYLYERFGINAMEMTTKQIMECIYSSDLRDKKEYMRHILNVADFVKFAKVRPLPADNIAAYENAVKFVEETIPVESPLQDKEMEEEGGDE